MILHESLWSHGVTGVEMFQTVYLCLVTGRMYFYLSPPTSNLNNIILILIYFHFLKLN